MSELLNELRNYVNTAQSLTEDYLLSLLEDIDLNIVNDVLRDKARRGITSIEIYVTADSFFSREPDGFRNFHVNILSLIQNDSENREQIINIKAPSNETLIRNSIAEWLNDKYVAQGLDVRVTTGINPNITSKPYSIVRIGWDD